MLAGKHAFKGLRQAQLHHFAGYRYVHGPVLAHARQAGLLHARVKAGRCEAAAGLLLVYELIAADMLAWVQGP